jgi:hypothetical protein
MKPLYKILIAFGVVLVLGTTIYFVWRSFTKETPTEKRPAKVSENIPTAPEQKTAGPSLKKLSDNDVLDFWVVPETKEIYYFTPDGRIFAAKTGPDLEISKNTVLSINSIEVSPDNQMVLVAFGDPRNAGWGIFDLIDGAWRPLPSGIVTATWQENKDRLVAVLKTPTETSLLEIDLTKNPPEFKTIVRDFRFKDIKLAFAAGKILIIEKGSAFYPSRVFQLDPKTLSLNLLFAPENGLTLTWSEDKSLFLKFNAAKELLLFDANLQPVITSVTAGGLLATLPQKCGFAKRKIYCFVPQTSVAAPVKLPDDYFQKNFYSVDSLISYDLDYTNPETGESGEIKKVFDSGTGSFPPIDGAAPKAIDQNVYFINRFDGGLYELSAE